MAMTWRAPDVVELKMDAEIGSYQEDSEREPFLCDDRRARAVHDRKRESGRREMEPQPTSRVRDKTSSRFALPSPRAATRSAVRFAPPLAAILVQLALSERPALAQLQFVPSIVRRGVTYERTGENALEYALTTTTLRRGFHKQFTIDLGGQVYAQILYLPNLYLPFLPLWGGASVNANVVFVATTDNVVAAVDADNGRVYWTNQYGPPITNANVPGGSCNNYNANVGIVGTPVIYNSEIYFVTRNLTSGCGPVPGASDRSNCTRYALHAVNILDGTETSGSPKPIGTDVWVVGTGDGGNTVVFNPDFENQRAALLDANGMIYIAFGSYCDHNPNQYSGGHGNYHGWLLEYDAATLGLQGIFNSTPNGSEGGIWQSGAGPARDVNGNVYVAVGNGSYDNNSDFGESIVQLPPPSQFFAPLAHSTPTNFSSLNSGDFDVGASGPLITTTASLIQVGKNGTFYNLSLNGLTAVQAPFTGIASGTNGGSVGYNVGAFTRSQYYLWGSGELMRTFPQVDSIGTLDTFKQPLGAIRANGSQPSGALAISSNASDGTLGSVIVWATNQTPRSANDPSNATVPGTLFAYSAQNLPSQPWTSDQTPGDALGSLAKFNPPTVANGKVYVPSFSSPSSTVVYGLSPVFWLQDYGFPWAHTSQTDWASGSYKGQCELGQPVTGLSAFTSGQQQAHEVLCSGWISNPSLSSAVYFGGQVPTVPFDSSLPASPWDWDSGYFKAECPVGYYVQGVSQSQSGTMNNLLCTYDATLTVSPSTCSVEQFGNGTDSADYAGPDWDVGYYKGQCFPGLVVAGVSSNAATGPAGAPHALLCCPP
jgi:hypothetical protein